MNSQQKHFVIDRLLDAPRDLVWQTFTQEKHLLNWWGPKGFKVTYCKLDLRTGGLFHYCLAMPTGDDMWGKWVFRQITPPERLVFLSSFSDAQAGTARHVMKEVWPLTLLTTIGFAEEGAKTRVTVDWIPENASAEENAEFDAFHDSMRGGWTGTFEQLADYLAKV
jgi:uncharacterized protein YndB with AHSA1/START domain